MSKKLGIVGVGVVVGLAVAAPFASATESNGGPGGGSAPAGPSSTCSVAGGSADATNGIGGDSLANVVAQAPVGGLNAANIVCNSILNDNLSNNVLELSVLGDGLPVLGDLLGL